MGYSLEGKEVRTLLQRLSGPLQAIAAGILTPAPDPREAAPSNVRLPFLLEIESERADAAASRARLERQVERLALLLPAIAAQVERSQALGDAGLLGDTGHLYAATQGTIAALRVEAERLAQRDQRLALISDYLTASVLTAEASRLAGVPHPMTAVPDGNVQSGR